MKKENKPKTKTITFEDLTGQKFGHLIVLKLDHIQDRTRYWLCECDCELHNKKIVKERYLMEGATQSCGCLRNKNNAPFMTSDAILTDSNKKLYGVWKNTMHRCYNINNKKYKEYGALGIIVCEDWKSFNTFENWSKLNGYKEGLALIRKDKHGNYEPDNCVWDIKTNYHKIQKDYEKSLEQSIQVPVTEIITEGKVIDMQDYLEVNNYELKYKTYKGIRVVTLKEIDLLHERPEGTASRNFVKNKSKFQEGIDYFLIKHSNIENNEKRCFGKLPNRGITAITESGYLMIVKTFEDDKAWQVQRQLVNSYFTVKQLKENPETKNLPQIQGIQSIDILSHIVNAFKEQQELINNQQNEINNQNVKINDIESKYNSLEEKLKNMVKAIS